ncbi:MAG: tRNA uridine-5-carboxymethylaminomethyl(34) synthesis enzyme MnmG, partial [Pirellulaceae bacterium]|nr:tRNA uridine-5-carboxymethylaminomethyl(34) synthesis enzyme MnmG [Pirellulaceae bacterium]
GEIERVRKLLKSRRHEDVSLEKFLRRPDAAWSDLSDISTDLADVSADVAQQVVHDVKYEGYVERQLAQIERQRRMASKKIPANFDYQRISHLRSEAREKLSRIEPTSLEQAERISGVTPADIALLLAHLEGRSPGARAGS